MELGEEQKEALERIEQFLNSDDIAYSLTGAAGTGKTVICSYIIKYLRKIRKDYCLCAPTHKAKTVIEYYTKDKALTLHKLLSLSPKLDIINLDFNDLQFEAKYAKETIPDNGVVICDESSMISDDLFDLLIEKCSVRGAKIIFIGDKLQLSPVKSERVSKVYSLPNSFTLTKIYRQDENNAILGTLETLRERQIEKFKTSIGSSGSLIYEPNFSDFFNICKKYIQLAIDTENIFAAKILAYTNNRVKNYNKFITESLFGDGSLYHKGEILTAYENLETPLGTFWNSMDYIITSKPAAKKINIPNFGSLFGYSICLYDTGNKSNTYVDILSPELPESDFEELAASIEDIRLTAIDATGKYKNKCWSKYYKMMESFTTPKDLYFDGRLIRKKSFDRGYATTVHKSQGSSFDTILIDMQNINKCPVKENIRQLQYVALSRTRNNAYIYQ